MNNMDTTTRKSLKEEVERYLNQAGFWGSNVIEEEDSIRIGVGPGTITTRSSKNATGRAIKKNLGITKQLIFDGEIIK